MSGKSAKWNDRQLNEALSLSVPGKTLKQLEDWCKKWSPSAISSLSDQQRKDRYSFVKIVEETQKDMKSQVGESGMDDEEEEKESQRKGTKRKSRLSIAYEAKPEPASPRVKAAVGGKRKSTAKRSSRDEEEEEDEAASGSESEISEAPAKKKVKTSSKSAARAKPSAKGRKSTTVVVEDEDEDESMDASSHDVSEDSDMHIVEPTNRSSLAKRPSASPQPAPSTTAPSSRRASAAFIDPSLFEDTTTADSDVVMKSSSPEDTDYSVPPPVSIPNPFQSTSPSVPAPAASQRSKSPAKSPFTTTTAAVSTTSPFLSTNDARRKSSSPAGVPRFNPHAAQPLSFPFSNDEEVDRSFPTHTSTSSANRRASMPAQSTRSPQDDALRRRFSMANYPKEEKYPVTYSAATHTNEHEDEAPAPLSSRKQADHKRRYSDKVQPYVADELQVGSSSTSAANVKLSLMDRCRVFLKSLFLFLLRTAVITGIVFTVAFLIYDGSLMRAFGVNRVSNTVFCPSNPEEATPTVFPEGQQECKSCPPHAFCTEGRMECFPANTYVREGDRCVLNDEAYRGAYRIKEKAIEILEKRRGAAECGELPLAKNDYIIDVLELKKSSFLELKDAIPVDSFESWWHEAQILLMKEAGRSRADEEVIGMRVIAPVAQYKGQQNFYAVVPQLSLSCQFYQLVERYMLVILAVSVVLSIITYLWFIFRRFRNRRLAITKTVEALRLRLQEEFDFDYGRGTNEFKPLAIAHMKQEFPHPDPLVWAKVVEQLNSDTRIEKSKLLFGNTERDAWTWTGPVKRR